MRRQGLNEIEHLAVTRGIIEDTVEVVGQFGEKGFEVLLLWLGEIEGTTARIDSVYVPPQKSVRGEEGLGYFVSNETLFELNKSLDRSGLRLIAQVHSHPGEAYHSEADDRFAIVTSEGGFSFVVPDFAQPPASPYDWAAYSLKNGIWQELSREQVQELFTIEETE
jgi:hypothetical protein